MGRRIVWRAPGPTDRRDGVLFELSMGLLWRSVDRRRDVCFYRTLRASWLQVLR